ncbi:MAG: glycosyltransferase family 4 protein, partial [Gammaproteobacteria bacterium]|nr:glycosyltransferase family 4 protein [Gammaproteobacteria bacterium]
LPEHHKRLNRWYLNATMPLYCRRATHIIAISECTQRDLMAAYGVPPDKITVIYEAASPHFSPRSAEEVARVRAAYHLPERYLLFVGTIEPRKNLIRLLNAFEVVHAEGLTDGLVIVGRRGWLADEFYAALEQSPARNAVHLPGYVADADLPALYTGAQALAMPSLYEGFGLPVLEAMACGAPVACSNTSSLPELTGQAAVHFAPDDTASITEALRDLLADAELRARLAAEGVAQARRFTWEQTAAQTRQVYQAVLEAAAGARRTSS